MPRFLTIGYGDEAGYARTAPAVRDAAHLQDAALRRAGAVIGRAGTPVQVRNPEGCAVETRQGAFLTAALPLAGFALIEAADLDAAIAAVARSPCAVAHGVVEVWPFQEG